jgi:TonB family protein
MPTYDFRLLSVTLAASVLLPLAASGSAPTAEAPSEAVPPQIILSSQKQPLYPPAAFKARYTGSVTVEMTVGKDGAVGDAKVLHCTRPKVGFEEAAIDAVKQWRFEPGTVDGEPVDVVTRLNLNFTRVGVGEAPEAVVSAGAFQTELRDSEGGADVQARSTTSRQRSASTTTSSTGTRGNR